MPLGVGLEKSGNMRVLISCVLYLSIYFLLTKIILLYFENIHRKASGKSERNHGECFTFTTCIINQR
jgi:hypothetical protein